MIHIAKLSPLDIDETIIRALREDINGEDISTNCVVKENSKGEVKLLSKDEGILCGLDVFQRVFTILDPETKFEINVAEGSKIVKGQQIAVIYGKIRTLLSGERLALNFLQRMSGIATYTSKMLEAMGDTTTKLVDTRKTTPNLRMFEKYSVRVGGGGNHRFNLSDGVMLKDNHIGAAGSVKKAIELAKSYAPFVRKIEVEVENMAMLCEAIEAKADIIMLDNMTPSEIKEAIKEINGRAEVELSGNISLENIREYSKLGADYISSGAITYSAPILDLSLKDLRPDQEK